MPLGGKHNATVFGGGGGIRGPVLGFLNKKGGKNSDTVFGGHGIRGRYWEVLLYIPNYSTCITGFAEYTHSYSFDVDTRLLVHSAEWSVAG